MKRALKNKLEACHLDRGAKDVTDGELYTQTCGILSERPSVEKNKPICVFRMWDDGTEAKTENKLLSVKEAIYTRIGRLELILYLTEGRHVHN